MSGVEGHLLTYDESDIVRRLAAVAPDVRTAFAVACANFVAPMFERYAHAIGAPELSTQLVTIVDSVWEALSDARTHIADLREGQVMAESMVPQEGEAWIVESGYAQNAAAAAAYAVRARLTGEPQEAAWAARQMYELADYAVLQIDQTINLNSPESEGRILATELIQNTLETLEDFLEMVGDRSSWGRLRAHAVTSGRKFAASVR